MSWDCNFLEGDVVIGFKDMVVFMKMLKGGNVYIEFWKYVNLVLKEKLDDYFLSDYGIVYFVL